VQRALAISEGNVSKAAKLLCVSRPHLYNLMKNSGLHLSDEKVGE
jgi:DNA-binding NtrC family response regulator